MDCPPLSEEELNEVYNYVDSIPLSRPKKNISRDFCDGVLLAEIIHHFIPQIVEVHNYSAAHSQQQKLYNWNTLNQKVLKKIGLTLSQSDIERIIVCTPEIIERVLKQVQIKVEAYLIEKKKRTELKKNEKNSQVINSGQHQPIANQMNQQQDFARVIEMKDEEVKELRETVEILELKITKLEQLIKLKDNKITTLMAKLQQYNIK